MNYLRLYKSIIESRVTNPPTRYSEHHHIIPRFAGGTDERDNLVSLTAREHFICHWLLTKIYPSGALHYKAIKAFGMMAWASSGLHHRYKCGSRLYELLRKKLSTAMSYSQQGVKNSQFDTKWISNPLTAQTKKINKTDPVPDGWIPGRNVKYKTCIECGTSFISTRKYCTPKCQSLGTARKIKQIVRSPTGFVTRKDEFFKLYNTGISISDCLRKMGYDPRCGDKRRYIKQWLSKT